MSNFLLFLFCCLCYGIIHAKSNEVTCLDYGYNPTALDCTTCDVIGQILGDQAEAKKKCLTCCNTIINAEEIYEKAVLEVDKRALPYMPDVQAVVEKKKDLKLSIRYRFGGSPRLLMYKDKDDDEPSESLSVYSWTKDTFIDYLKSHVRSLVDKKKN